jgi:large subunit ribosomal protein L35
MPKMKTNRGAAKRLKATGGSKIKRGSAFRRHILTCKNRKTKRKLRAGGYVHPANSVEVRRMLPYA